MALCAALHPPPRAAGHGRLRPRQRQHVLQPNRRRRHHQAQRLALDELEILLHAELMELSDHYGEN